MASLIPLQNALASVKTQVEQSKLALQLLHEASHVKSSFVLRPKSVERESRIETDEVSSAPAGIELKNINFSYPGAASPALIDVSIKIVPGDHVAFVGPSGAGKTTLVDLILGLLEPSSGELIIGGEPMNGSSPAQPWNVAYVPQRPGLVSGSIAENVALGVEGSLVEEEKVWLALKAAHLQDFVSELPEGIHTSVGTQKQAFSGGQIQRLGLARALYTEPKLIILDEATSALDAASEAYISKSLEMLGRDVTVLVIAHRLSTIQHSDCVYFMQDGRIAASGTFAHLRKTVPTIAEYVKLMSFSDVSD